MRQILLNLLGNAFKFTHEGSVSLHVSVESYMDMRLKLLFEIHDTGIGIAKENQLNIFESFSSDEEHSILEGYEFTLETEEGDQPFTIIQYYEDIKKFTVIC